MIIDTFLYAGYGAEPDILEWRMRELWDVVDLFIAVGGDRTFQGAPKESFPADTVERFRWANRRLMFWHALLQEQAAHPMDREIVQRNAIARAVEAASVPAGSTILVSDVDELPRAASVQRAAALLAGGTPAVAFDEALFHGFINHRCITHPWWQGTRAIRRESLGERDNGHLVSPQTLRMAPHLTTLQQAGHHFSFLGGPGAMAEKLHAWSHFEWDRPPLNSLENLAAALSDVRDWDTERAMRYELVPVDDSYPAWIYQHRQDPAIAQYIHAEESPQ